MKKHDYLNLKIGAIEQYAMIVKKRKLKKWQKLGWFTYKQVNLPKGDEQASMLYGEIGKKETLVFNRPTLLKDTPFEQLIGLKVLEISTHLGSYGMGGAGFFGLRLNNKHFLTYAVWNSGNFVLVDNRVVKCSPDFYDTTRPLISNFGDDLTWDEITPLIVGSQIIAVKIAKHSCQITLQKDEKTHIVEFVKKDSRIPQDEGKLRVGYKKGKISDYLLFQRKNAVLVV